MNVEVKVPVPGEKVARLIGVGLVLLFVVAVAALIWLAGKHSAEKAATEDQLEVTEQSADISRKAGETVAVDQANTWKFAQADEGAIRARIEAQPRAAGPADPDVLRVARQAHARALCSAGRVHGAGCGDDAAGTAEQ